MLRLALVLLAAMTVHAQAADIGGWMQQQSRAALARDDCPQIVREAATSTAPDAGLFYAAGLCYQLSDALPRDRVAAAAWLTRAAQLEHPLARRALLALGPDANAIPHSAGAHCHDLGEGRRLCHGGTPPP